MKNEKFLFSHFFLVPQKDFNFFRLQKRSVKIKKGNFCPLFQIGTARLRLGYCAISVTLTIEIHENNIDISRVTNKQFFEGYIFSANLYET